MRFKTDENLPTEFTEALRTSGHDGMSVWDQSLTGENDSVIIQVCQTEQRCLITLDTDFCDLRTYPPDDTFGIIVLRLRRQDKLYLTKIAKRLAHILTTEDPAKHLWIVEEDRIRIRGELPR